MTGRATHGHTRGRKISPTMMSWLAMRSRCSNPNNEKYPSYGAVGIVVCQRWQNSFENFLADMGERPEGHTLDRFPNRKGNYEPDNCRWATKEQQSENRDKINLGWRRNRTHCSHGHEFSEENTRVLPNGARKCRKCECRHAAEARAKRRVSA